MIPIQDPKDKSRAGAFGDPWGVAKLLNLPEGRVAIACLAGT